MLQAEIGQNSPMPAPPSITTVLLDLDGVIRHFDTDHRSAIEAAAGLTPGTLWDAAFEPRRIDDLITGRMTRAEWTEAVGEAVGNPNAAAEWLGEKGTVDLDMIALIDQLRANGTVVAILTNGTDTIPAELAELGVTEHVDAVFNTAEIGYAKPDPRAFEHACNALGVDPTQVFFTDDSERKLAGALTLGMTAEHFIGVAELQHQLASLGVLSP